MRWEGHCQEKAQCSGIRGHMQHLQAPGVEEGVGWELVLLRGEEDQAKEWRLCDSGLETSCPLVPITAVWMHYHL